MAPPVPPLVVLTRASAASSQTLAADVVAERWGRPVRELRFERSASGKPYVLDAEGTPGPAFNVSDTQGWVAVAVADADSVGVDIELTRPPKPRVAQRVFGDDAASLDAEEFTCRWTIAEACAKADGRGIGLLLDGFGPIQPGPAGEWGRYRWWSGRVGEVHWALALTGADDLPDPVVRAG